MPEHPKDVAVGLEHPSVAFGAVVQFEVIEKVAHKFTSIKSKRLDAVALAPVPQHDALAVHQAGVECHFALAVAHQWREWSVDVRYGHVDRTHDIIVKANGYLHRRIVCNGFDINRLSVNEHGETIRLELASAVTLVSGRHSLLTLPAGESQMADAVVEQGRGLWERTQCGNVDMPLVGQDVVYQRGD